MCKAKALAGPLSQDLFHCSGGVDGAW